MLTYRQSNPQKLISVKSYSNVKHIHSRKFIWNRCRVNFNHIAQNLVLRTGIWCEWHQLTVIRKSISYCDVSTHWGRVTHICVSKLTNIGSDNVLSPGRCQAIIFTNAGIVLIGPIRINFNEMLIKFMHFHSQKCIWKCRLENGGHFVSASMCFMWLTCFGGACLWLGREAAFFERAAPSDCLPRGTFLGLRANIMANWKWYGYAISGQHDDCISQIWASILATYMGIPPVPGL